MKKPNIDQMQSDFRYLQTWVQGRIRFYTTEHKPPYSQAALAKDIDVNPKTVLFGLELSENMSYRKWMELASGILKLDEEKK